MKIEVVATMMTELAPRVGITDANLQAELASLKTMSPEQLQAKHDELLTVRNLADEYERDPEAFLRKQAAQAEARAVLLLTM